MSDLSDRIREYMRESADRKLTIGRMTVSRLAIFGIAGVILAVGAVALFLMLFAKRETGLTFARADVVNGYSYRIKDDRTPVINWVLIPCKLPAAEG